MRNACWVLTAALCVPGGLAEAGGRGETRSFPELELELELPDLVGLVQGAPEGMEDTSLVAWWTGRLNGKRFSLSLSSFDRDDWGLYEPADAAQVVIDHQRSAADRFDVREESLVRGSYGWAPHACLVVADVTPATVTAPTQRHFVLCGLLQESGYALHALVEPLPDAADEALVRGFLERGVRFGGPRRDPRWTDAEVLERWRSAVPEDLHGDFAKALKKKSTAKQVCVRTEHYLILTNSSGGKLFAQQMEENHERVRETFPFPEVEDERLLPVFLFRTQDEYARFNVLNTGASPEGAARSKGYAWKDYYATYYESPKDPVHIHEQTHQIFANRLRLRGGGSWFQEGVAEYVETTPNDRNVVARRVRDGSATALRELVGLRSLLYSSETDLRDGNQAGEHYKQAALLIEFLRESEFGRERFETFLQTLGRVGSGDVAGIDAGFRAVFGVGLEGVEEAWRAYCGKR